MKMQFLQQIIHVAVYFCYSYLCYELFIQAKIVSTMIYT